MKRTLISLDRRSLVARINAGDPLAIAEGKARNESRARKGKAPVKAYEQVGVTAPAPQADPLAGIPDAVLAALAARLGLQVPAAPAPATCVNPDVQVWRETFEACGKRRWESYTRLADAGWTHKRIAAASGFAVGTVANGIYKFRKGIKPDLSFCGK